MSTLPDRPIRVVLADDHPVFRTGLRSLLEEDASIEIAGEASDGQQALRLVRGEQPDVLVLDLELPALSGLEVARQLAAEASATRVLILSVHEEASYVRALLSTGVAGYLSKAEAGEVIVQAVVRIAAGEEGWFSRAITGHLVTLAAEREADDKILSDRESEVLRLVARGLSNKQIATRLGISQHTVKNHLARIYPKLGVQSRVEATLWAQRHGLSTADA